MRKQLEKWIGTGRLFKFLFNVSPMYWSTGGRVMSWSDDHRNVKIKLPLNYRTTNYVGTLYGGSLYSCVDGIYMVQLINILGKEYVVWDKSATIRFRRPGNQTLYAEFDISDAFLNQLKLDVAAAGELDRTMQVNLVDKDGKVYAEVEKVLYFATKEFYRQKMEKRGRTANV